MPSFPEAPEVVEPVREWHRLHPRMLIVRPLNETLTLLPVIVIFVVLGNGDPWRIGGGGFAILVIVGLGFLHWRTTKYRITAEQVELHTGLFVRKRLAVPRERIRTVDLTAKLGHRIFGLSAVRVGTGQHSKEGSDGGLTLDAVTSEEAERLRMVLLEVPTATAERTDEVVERPQGVVLAELNPKWLRYAPLSLSGLVAVGAAFGFVANYADDLNLHVVDRAADWVMDSPSALTIAKIVGVVVVLAFLASIVVYVLQYWNYRLTREPDQTVRVQRGLLTSRSVSVSELRLRGVEVQEPLLLRLGGGAKAAAVTTGLGSKGESSLLLPPAPNAEAHRVGAEVLSVADAPTLTALVTHPAAALRRRMVRAIVPVVLLAVGLAIFAPGWAWPIAVALLPFAALLGWDRYRALGHAMDERYLLTRSGSLLRETVALQRTGIIGWQVHQSFFQRRAGLVTVIATTAAGDGAYHVTDVGTSAGLALADEAVPGLLRPFLDQQPG
ncbi:PH domain-containing protein [Lentzea tibetensis]|uniref:PH domain-containing protein n=1 Tax=Lentzea tibetensis TaxID=2591470 RepID=A0A563EYM4_9PSEU|nr:PH domain-containing protein [Lentzea tibetensis]TWP52723.1 PH domain-containing protein [Lentzea tibetensis]